MERGALQQRAVRQAGRPVHRPPDLSSQRQIAGQIETLLLNETPIIYGYFYNYLSAIGQERERRLPHRHRPHLPEQRDEELSDEELGDQTTGRAGPELTLRFLSGPDIDGLGVATADIVAAVQDAVRAHGEGAVVFEPRVHLVPDNGGAGHFNVLRGHLSGPGAVSGIKVVGDFRRNWQRGLPSEMGLLTLYDPETGTPRAVLDATLITACRTGAMTAVGARFLARPDARVLGHAGSRGTAFWNVTLLDALFGRTRSG